MSDTAEVTTAEMLRRIHKGWNDLHRRGRYRRRGTGLARIRRHVLALAVIAVVIVVLAGPARLSREPVSLGRDAARCAQQTP